MSFGFPTQTAAEGVVKVQVPKLAAFVKKACEYAPSKAPVFYNPAMELNRDIAVVAVQTYQRSVNRELSVCEPLAGCGIRGIRLAAEVKGVKKVIVNDISSEAAKLAEYNVNLNHLAERIAVANEDANLLLSRYAGPHRRFDYIDIDPFGSPAQYLDSAVRALKHRGFLALTATDMAPLCGVHARACARKYGGQPLRTEYCHELAIRLLVGCLVFVASKHDIAVQPMFSYSTYNYVRTYVAVVYGAKKADKSVASMGYILHCFSCFHRESHKRINAQLKQDCPECGSKLQAAGPLWLGSLWDEAYCAKMKQEIEGRKLGNEVRIRQMILLAIGEASAPLTYFVVDKLCDKLNLPVPPLSKVMIELRGHGFQAVLTHFNSKAFRTDAPAKFVKETITKLAEVQSQKRKKLI